MKSEIPPQINSKDQRESSFELLRLLSQLIIVIYHIYYLFLGKIDDDPTFKAIQMPLHVGVIVFVLLSGYFSIKATSKKLIKLLAIFLVYTMPETFYTLTHANSLLHAVHSLFLLSYTHFWFIKTYLFLFLVSPMLNLYWHNSTNRQRWFMTMALGFVAIYMATTHGDKSMLTGKNLVNFMFLYYVGRLLSLYKYKWQKQRFLTLVSSYIFLNVIIVIAYLLLHGAARKLVWSLSYPYSSPLLLINAVLLFMIVGKFQFQSKIVNYLAASSLAIYLIHGCRPYIIGSIGDISYYLYNHISNGFLLFASCMALALLVLLFSITVDKLLTPIWKYVDKAGTNIYKKLGY